MLLWSEAKVKQYSALKGIDSRAWEKVTTFIKNEKLPLDNQVTEQVTMVTFTERLLREILPLNPFQQIELVTKLAKNNGYSKADLRAKRKEQQKMTAYRLHRLGWTQEEIGDVINLNHRTVSVTYLPIFPALEKLAKNLLDSGIPHLDAAGMNFLHLNSLIL